jgi:hypothetical protein
MGAQNSPCHSFCHTMSYSDFLDHLVQGVEFLTPFRAWRVHLLLILPDTGLHQTLNQRPAAHVAGHEFFQFFFELLLVCKKRIGFGDIDKGATGLIICQTGSPFDMGRRTMKMAVIQLAT